MHSRAVRLKKMTDAQLCEFIDRTYGRGMEEGAKLAQTKKQEKPEDAAEQVKQFIDYLTERIGSGNRIGRGAILQLNRELENAINSGLFAGGASR